jgi:hypothetical protein
MGNGRPQQEGRAAEHINNQKDRGFRPGLKKLRPGLNARATAASVRNFGYLVQLSKQQQGFLMG